MRGVPDARNRFAHPELLAEGLEPYVVAEVRVLSPNDRADRYVDLTEHFGRKMTALAAHVSKTAHLIGLEDAMREWGALQPARPGSARAASPRGTSSSTPAERRTSGQPLGVLTRLDGSLLAPRGGQGTVAASKGRPQRVRTTWPTNPFTAAAR